jgi:hypothetical protein
VRACVRALCASALRVVKRVRCAAPAWLREGRAFSVACMTPQRTCGPSGPARTTRRDARLLRCGAAHAARSDARPAAAGTPTRSGAACSDADAMAPARARRGTGGDEGAALVLVDQIFCMCITRAHRNIRQPQPAERLPSCCCCATPPVADRKHV